MAVVVDDPQRQPSPREPGRPQGRRTPGVIGFACYGDDRALLRHAPPRGPGGGEAACEPGVPRHPVPPRQPDPREAREFPWLQGRAELPLAHQGRRRRRLLDRLGRARRGADAVRLAGAGLCPRPWRRRRAPRGPHGGAGRRRRDGRGQHLRGAARRLEARHPQHLVGGRLQPPEPRRGDPRGPVVALRGDVPELRLGRRDPQIRRAAGGGLPRAGRRGAPDLHRHMPEPALFGAHLPGRRGLAEAPPRHDRRPGPGLGADRATLRRGAGEPDDQPRRPRPAVAARGVRGGVEARPADLLHRVHDQGPRPAACRPQGQPCRPDDDRADGHVPGRDGRPPRPRMGPLRGPVAAREDHRPLPRQGAVQPGRDAPPPRRSGPRAGAARGRRAGGGVHPVRLRQDPRRGGAGGRRLRRCDRHHLAGRHGLDQPRPVRQPSRAVRARRDGRHLPRGADRIDTEVGLRAEGPAHRARHRRDEPVHPALGARAVAFAVRAPAPAGRHALRSVHPARSRCAQLCLLPGRPVPPGGDAVRGDAGARGRCAPVDRDAADRPRAGRPRRLRAGLRRRACGDHALRLRLHAARRRGRVVRTHMAPRRDRRLGLSPPLDAARGADPARDDRRPRARHPRRGILDAEARAERRGGCGL